MAAKRDWWRKGKALDLWSIPHVLFGVLTGFLPQLTGLSFLTALALTIIFALSWEIYEKFAEIKETVLNSLFDIVLPVLSFTLTSHALIWYPISYDDLVVVATAVFIVYAFTNISGWLAYRRRDHNFRN